MPPINAKLVTIITESGARERVAEALLRHGVRGHSLGHVDGAGAHGTRIGGFFESKNVMFLTVVSESTATSLLEWVEGELVPAFPSIAYMTDVVAVPGDHF
jgi:nitrogen regulatory protein P-II 2